MVHGLVGRENSEACHFFHPRDFQNETKLQSQEPSDSLNEVIDSTYEKKSLTIIRLESIHITIKEYGSATLQLLDISPAFFLGIPTSASASGNRSITRKSCSH